MVHLCSLGSSFFLSRRERGYRCWLRTRILDQEHVNCLHEGGSRKSNLRMSISGRSNDFK